MENSKAVDFANGAPFNVVVAFDIDGKNYFASSCNTYFANGNFVPQP